MTTAEINRRKLLTLLGGAGVGSVVLGACRGSDKGSDSPSAGPASTSGGSTTTTTAPPSGAAKPITPDMFESAAACSLTPEQTEGPYYIDVDNVRSDIREDRPGTQLRVAVRVMNVDRCTPVRDAVFEIWHCDAGGVYSGFEGASGGAGGGPRGPEGGAGAGRSTDATRYLRGAQVTNGDGIAAITTIYPGWYQGRTVHVHAKVHLTNATALTTQLYFDDKLSEQVFATAPYTAHKGRSTFNQDDSIYRKDTTLTVASEAGVYLGLITMGVAA